MKVNLLRNAVIVRVQLADSLLGMGPMFEEEEVRKVIEEVGRSGNDELI